MDIGLTACVRFEGGRCAEEQWPFSLSRAHFSAPTLMGRGAALTGCGSRGSSVDASSCGLGKAEEARKSLARRCANVVWALVLFIC